MNFDDDEDESTGFLNKNTEYGRTSDSITEALQKSYATSALAQRANVKLRD